MSVTATFTVTVVSAGGNKYAIDGSTQATVNLAVAGTYRFDQSDSSNNGHPLLISTNDNNSPAAPYTTGVTSVGTPGYAGAYTQIVVANDAPSTLYYYCFYHSGMGGQINTSANAYGAFTWNKGAWNSLNDEAAAITGQSLTLSQGTTTANAEIRAGWSRGAWSSATWNQAPDSFISLTTAGQLDTSLNLGFGWSRESWNEGDWNSSLGFVLTGNGNIFSTTTLSALNSSVNSVTARGNVDVTISGENINVSEGNIVLEGEVKVVIVGEDLVTATVNTFAVVANGAVTINTPTLQSNTAIGTTTTGTANLIEVTGQDLNINLGNITTGSFNIIEIAGMNANANVGTMNFSTGQILTITGQSLTISLANIVPTSQNFLSIDGNQANITSSTLKFWDPIVDNNQENWTNIH